MRLDSIIARVSSDLGLPRDFVRKVYYAYWRTIREYISSQPLKEDLSDEEFESLRPNVSITAIGKFGVLPGRYRAMKEDYNNFINNKDNNAAYQED